MKPQVICLMGPTASGKTGYAAELVQEYPLDIISVDSALVYRGMDIGTAKPDAETLALAPHRLIDIRDPAEAYSAAEFIVDAKREIAAVHAKGRVPILVGGTMLYYQALLRGMSELPEANPEIRAELVQEAEASSDGWAVLHRRLELVDPAAAARIHPNDPQRLQRALEVYEITGVALSELQTRNKGALVDECSVDVWALFPEDRTILHQRIAERFNIMLEQGVVAEVEALKSRPDLHESLPSMKSVGYRQIWQYLQGELDYQGMIDKGIVATRQLAKRQMTWLRRQDTNLCLDPFARNDANIMMYMKKRLAILLS